jgi:Gas vesicle synthesis protein GvpL/GvpF
MPLLAYCIVQAGCEIETPSQGVRGSAIRTVTESGLTAFFSEYAQSQNGNRMRETAVEFNHLLQRLLRQVAIVPFRFPTVIADESEISGFLRQHANEYRNTLQRIRDAVQMEVSLTLADSPPATQESGAEYLRERQNRHRKLADAAGEIYKTLSSCIHDWHQHENAKGMGCYMLVSRNELETLLDRLRGMNIPSDLRARVTGPWPATEFIALKSDGDETCSLASRIAKGISGARET